MGTLTIADSKDNLHDPHTLDWKDGKNLFGFSRHSSHPENSFHNESLNKIQENIKHSNEKNDA